MTQRIVWLMGVAAVATMVILAGCGDGPGSKPADPVDPPDPPDPPPAMDYVTALAGTWTATVDRQVLADPADPTTLIDLQTAVTATIAAGEMANTGALTMTIVNTVVLTSQSQPPITVSGTIAVDAAAITVTITGVEPEPTDPQEAQILAVVRATPQTLTYTLSGEGSMLTVGNDQLLPLLLGGSPSITLTKEMAS